MMSSPQKTILITGGAGFIGSNLVHYFVKQHPEYHIVNLDALTYAGNLTNLKAIEKAENYTFVKADITDASCIDALFERYQFDQVIHLAAESHVDRSIADPLAFAQTNILGTMVLLNAFKTLWKDHWEDKLFYHVSTDEVYGTLGEKGLFTEQTPYSPNSPYSASKASSDHFVRAYGETYGLPYLISNCSNNYGPYQFPEKLIPLFINNILEQKKLPVYGQGLNTRDWLFVNDHVRAIDEVLHHGTCGETYNIGGFNEWKNIDLVRLLCQLMDQKLHRESGTSEQLITFITDRPGHDLRYAIDASKLHNQLGWRPQVSFEEGLLQTIDWYLNNTAWLNAVTSGDYQAYYQKMYTEEKSPKGKIE